MLLLLLPWSAFWDRNYFTQAWPWLHEALTSAYARGAVSGLGLVNIYAALAELADLFTTRDA